MLFFDCLFSFSCSVSFLKISVRILSIHTHTNFYLILLITETTKGLSLLHVFPTGFCSWWLIFVFCSLGTVNCFIGLYLWEFWRVFVLTCFLLERIYYFLSPNLDVIKLALHYAIIVAWGFLDHADYVNSNCNPFGGMAVVSKCQRKYTHVHTHTHPVQRAHAKKNKSLFFILPVFCSPEFSSSPLFHWGCYLSRFLISNESLSSNLGPYESLRPCLLSPQNC